MRLRAGPADERVDTLAVEEPLEIRIAGATQQMTMRTPGNDIELVHGLLFTQGFIHGRRDIVEAYRCSGGSGSTATQGNAIDLVMAPGVVVDARRGVATTTSCGVCGTDSIQDVLDMIRGDLSDDHTMFDAQVVASLPERLRAHQPVFARTGAIHAAGLFTADGTALCVREDVGRHNAVDKVIGNMLVDDRLPAAGTVLVVSGRASFDLVQKAAAAGIPALVAVSAPSSLAVDLADRVGITLIGFARGSTSNVYTHPQRIRVAG
jgi:FdhD protein